MPGRVVSSKFASFTLVAVALLVPMRAEATTRIAPLCTSVKGVCAYTNTDAPVLRANVCWDKSTIRLMPAAGCSTGAYPYYVDYGEVIDPLLGIVAAYIPLPDACDLGYCSSIDAYDNGPLEGAPLCCQPESDQNCVEVEGNCDGDIVFCEQAGTNDDGTVACFD
jgi:hypothetical protein